MQTQEITFAELRNAYTQVREFVKNETKLEESEIGLYSTIIDNLGVEAGKINKFYEKFVTKFDIAKGTYKIPYIIEEKIEKVELQTEAKALKIFGIVILVVLSPIILPLLLYVLVLAVLICIPVWGIISLISWLLKKFYPNISKKLPPNKKDWQQDKLTVADLVSTLIAKEYMPKKNVNYVLKKCE